MRWSPPTTRRFASDVDLSVSMCPMSASRFRWSEISTDPNAPEVLVRRNAVLAATRAPVVRSRPGYLVGLARDRQVLDIGVVEHRVESRDSPQWLHRRLVGAAARCVGVDVLEDEVDALRAEGFDVRCHDLSVGPLDERFEVIVVGEVVEHLGAPVAMLVSAREMLLPGGRIVVTTPNPYMVHRVWANLRGSFPDSADHTLLVGPSHMLEIADRAGLALDSWRGVRLRDLRGVRNRVASMLRKALTAVGFAPELACDTLIFELVDDA